MTPGGPSQRAGARPERFEAPGRGGADRRLPRDPLPLPRFSPGPRPSTTGSVPRGTAKRRALRWHHQLDVFRCVGAINSLYTGQPDPCWLPLDGAVFEPTPDTSLVQSLMLRRINESVEMLGPPATT